MDEDLYDDDELDVVILVRDGDRIMPVTGSAPIALDEPIEPVDELLDALLASSVRVAAMDGAPPEVLAALQDIPVPAAFRCSPWLAEHRLVVTCDGTADVGGFRLHYSERGGLMLPYPEPDEPTSVRSQTSMARRSDVDTEDADEDAIGQLRLEQNTQDV